MGEQTHGYIFYRKIDYAADSLLIHIAGHFNLGFFIYDINRGFKESPIHVIEHDYVRSGQRRFPALLRGLGLTLNRVPRPVSFPYHTYGPAGASPTRDMSIL